MPGPLRKEMLTCFQAYCAEANANATYMTTAGCNILETVLCQRYAATQVAIIFYSKVSYDMARSLQTPAAPAANLVSDTTSLLTLDKVIETLRPVSAPNFH